MSLAQLATISSLVPASAVEVRAKSMTELIDRRLGANIVQERGLEMNVDNVGELVMS